MTQIFFQRCPENKVGTAVKKEQVDKLLKDISNCVRMLLYKTTVQLRSRQRNYAANVLKQLKS